MRQPNTVNLSQLTRTYFSEGSPPVHALGPVDLTIGRGEVVSVVGPSGCGKSTLLRIIAGLDAPTRGKIEVEGRRGDRVNDNMGVVFQKDLLLDWRNVLENVLLPAAIRGEQQKMRPAALRLLEQFDLAAFVNNMPWELSGGMRQRVSIARALLYSPGLLLLDEPFSSLDALTRDRMNLFIQDVQLAHKCSTLLITHSITEAIFLADRVAVMSSAPGRFVDLVSVNLPRPRTMAAMETVEFNSVAHRVRKHFELVEDAADATR